MQNDIERILINQQTIEDKCEELGNRISVDYAETKNKLLVICLLNGSIPFFAQLIKSIDIEIEYDCISIKSYEGTKSCNIQILKDINAEVKNRDILLVEDIVDTGRTLGCVKALYTDRGATSIKIVSLLNKPSRRTEEVLIDYCGFDIEDEYVVGYGMDYNQSYRNLPYIGILKKEVYQSNGG
ncbi:MAG: hypoxanthine phosphoribosyltransferase [Erysipelotrichaceae bacterium]